MVAAYQKVIECLADRSFENVDPDLLFHWQRHTTDIEKAYLWREGLGPQKLAFMKQLEDPSIECAQEAGYDVAQDAAWLAEVRRLVKEEPGRAQVLVDHDLLGALESPGVAAFLTRY